MAVLSDYTSGTITLANGSTTVTGTGTLFQTAAFTPGDTLQIQNLTAVIASVNSNTSLTLTAPWTGTSITNGAYRARYLPDNSRVAAQSTTLIELLGNGVLSSIATLGAKENQLLVGNAAGQYVLIDKAKLGVADPNGSLASLAALKLAARQILQTDDKGALKAVAMAANKALTTDANGDIALSDITAAALVLLKVAGAPAAGKLAYFTGAGTAALTDITALGRALLALTGTNGNIPVMTAAGTVASRPIVGTVSQSGGIPTGGIIEKGSNANGQYVRLADGTQICWRIFSQTHAITDAMGAGFLGYFGNWVYPAAFISPAAFAGNGRQNGATPFWMSADAQAASATATGAYMFAFQSIPSSTLTFNMSAIGRWY